MERAEQAKMIAAISMFALGAVVVILYHHASSTQSVLNALGASPAGTGTAGGAATQQPAAQPFSLGTPLSLAGMVTPGQAGSSMAPAVVPLTIGGGYIIQ